MSLGPYRPDVYKAWYGMSIPRRILVAKFFDKKKRKLSNSRQTSWQEELFFSIHESEGSVSDLFCRVVLDVAKAKSKQDARDILNKEVWIGLSII